MENSFLKDLSKLQSLIKNIKKNERADVTFRSGGSRVYSYASLDALIDAIREPLGQCNFSLIFNIEKRESGTYAKMELFHISGDTMSSEIPVEMPNPFDIQKLGSLITYSRRYLTQNLLNIAAEEDDDGNKSSGNVVKPVVSAKELVESVKQNQQKPTQPRSF